MQIKGFCSMPGEDVDSKSGREAFMVRLKFTPKGRKLLCPGLERPFLERFAPIFR